MQTMRVRFIANRVNAILAIRATTFVAFAKRLGVSCSHLRCVIAANRVPSQRLLAALKQELDDAWLFVTGDTDTLVGGGGKAAG